MPASARGRSRSRRFERRNHHITKQTHPDHHQTDIARLLKDQRQKDKTRPFPALRLNTNPYPPFPILPTSTPEDTDVKSRSLAGKCKFEARKSFPELYPHIKQTLGQKHAKPCAKLEAKAGNRRPFPVERLFGKAHIRYGTAQ